MQTSGLLKQLARTCFCTGSERTSGNVPCKNETSLAAEVARLQPPRPPGHEAFKRAHSSPSPGSGHESQFHSIIVGFRSRRSGCRSGRSRAAQGTLAATPLRPLHAAAKVGRRRRAFHVFQTAQGRSVELRGGRLDDHERAGDLLPIPACHGQAQAGVITQRTASSTFSI